MGKGLAFLMVKPWHPLTKKNQERKFIVEQQESDRKKREVERADELARENDFWDTKNMATQNTSEAAKLKLQAPVAFLYQPPPTLFIQSEREERQKRETDIYGPKQSKGPQSERDKLVEKFPFLANAPQEGRYTENQEVVLKPFGQEVRHVRCLRCGQWGHQAGEKICPLFNEMAANDSVNKALLDPMRVEALVSVAANPVRKLPSYDDKGAKLELRHAPRARGASPIRGGLREDDELNLLDFDEHSGMHDREKQFLASLTEEEKQLVLEQLLQDKEAKKQKQKQKRTLEAEAEAEPALRSKKHKHKHRKSESDDSDDSDDADERHRKRKQSKEEKKKDKADKKAKKKEKRREKKERHTKDNVSPQSAEQLASDAQPANSM